MAVVLTRLIELVLENPDDIESWILLHSVFTVCLGALPRGGKKRQNNLVTTVNKKLNSYCRDTVANFKVDSPKRGKKKLDTTISSLINSKLEDGEVKGAIRIASGNESMAEPTKENVAKLKQKHPNSILSGADLPSATSDPLQIDEHAVLLAIKTFPAGSAGGPDKLRP